MATRHLVAKLGARLKLAVTCHVLEQGSIGSLTMPSEQLSRVALTF